LGAYDWLVEQEPDARLGRRYRQGVSVEVRIGVVQSPKEIEVDLPEGADADQLASQVEAALASESGVLWLTDRRGRRVGIPSARIAYVELNLVSEERRVGFGAALR